MSVDGPRFLKLKGAAEMASVGQDTLRKAINAGQLKAKRTGRNKDGDPVGDYLISVKALEEWFEQLADA